MDRADKRAKGEEKGARSVLSLSKSRWTLLILGVVGVLLMVFSSLFVPGEKKDSAPAYADVDFYTSYLEQRIEALCVSIGGVDEASVFLTVDCSSEYVYGEGTGSDYLIVKGENGEEALLLCEIYPKVRGVAVVCTDGDLPRVQQTVTELLSAALDLPSSKIRVAGK